MAGAGVRVVPVVSPAEDGCGEGRFHPQDGAPGAGLRLSALPGSRQGLCCGSQLLAEEQEQGRQDD